jgi:hypothetical protein
VLAGGRLAVHAEAEARRMITSQNIVYCLTSNGSFGRRGIIAPTIGSDGRRSLLTGVTGHAIAGLRSLLLVRTNTPFPL